MSAAHRHSRALTACFLLLSACSEAGSKKADYDNAPPAEAKQKEPLSSARPQPATDGQPAATASPKPTGRKPRASVRAASTTSMSGRLTTQQVESAVADNIDRFASCSDGDVTVTLRALVADTGKVVNASAGRSTPDEARVRDCVVSAFKSIQFPSSPDGKSAPIEFDLMLSAST
jgi:hypothetical protein